MPRIAKSSKVKSRSAKRAPRQAALRAAAGKKVRRGTAAAVQRAPAKRALAKKAARKSAARKPATALRRIARATQKAPPKAAPKKRVASNTATAPRQKQNLSADVRKKQAGEHLRTLLEDKKRQAAQTPVWQTIVHHDHAPRVPDAMPHGASSGSIPDHVPSDADDDN